MHAVSHNPYVGCMRSEGSPAELERRRLLAVKRVLEGYAAEEVAEFFEIDASSIRRWLSAFRRGGWRALFAKPTPGRPGKLTRTQEKIVRRWLAESPTEHGFATELWTAARLAQVIWEEWGIRFSHRYLPRWLDARGFSPQKPERMPRERNQEVIAAWVQTEWPRIKKKRSPSAHM
jgi:transposase